MSEEIGYLRTQFEEVTRKYEEFRQSPENEVEVKRRAYMDALDALGHMYELFKEDISEGVNFTREEQDFLGLLEDREALENVIRGHYCTQHGLLDGFVSLEELERIEEIRKASEGELYDFKKVLKELGIDLDKE